MVDDGTIAYQEADWLRYPNRSADFETPLELIAKGKLKEAAYVYGDDVATQVPDEFLPQGERRVKPGDRPRHGAGSSR